MSSRYENKEQANQRYCNAERVVIWESLRRGYVSEQEVVTFKSLLGARLNEDSAILEVACGSGRYTPFLDTPHYIGLDISPVMISQARLNYPTKQFMQGDAFNMAFSQRFDIVFCCRFIHHYSKPQIEQFFTITNTALKDGGFFVFDSTNYLSLSTIFKTLFQFDVHNKQPAEILHMCHRTGFRVVSKKHYFFLPSFIYPFIPTSFAKDLDETLSPLLPARSFWCVQKMKESNV